jgi:uncharacterized membrane protein
MSNIKIVYLFNIVLITLCCGQSAYADERVDSYEQQLGQIQQQLSNLKSIEWEIEQLEKQMNFQREQLFLRSAELNKDITGVKKQLGIQGEQLTQIEENVTGNENISEVLSSELNEVRKQLELESAELANGMLNLDNKLIDEITDTNNKLEQSREIAISNQQKLANLQDVINRLESELNTRAFSSDLDQKISSVNQDISSVNQDVSLRTLYVVISIVILIIIISLFKRRFTMDNTVLSGEITKTRDILDSDIDVKLSKYLEEQMKLAAESSQGSTTDGQGDIDHSLPLHVATEIHRMRKRIDSMADDTKGIKPLAKALERLEESLDEQNYEIVDLLGQKYIEGMTVNLEFKLDEELGPDEKLITKVIKPQVNYNDIIVQVADIIVSTGE